MPMNRYTVYAPSMRRETEHRMIAESSFAARRQAAADWNAVHAEKLDLTDFVAIRDNNTGI